MDKPKFVYVTYINATAEKVWEALTSPKFTRQYWFGCEIESDWNVGSEIVVKSEGQVWHRDTVLQCQRPHLLAYSWRPLMREEFRNEKPSRVTFEISPSGKGVRLTVTHDDFPEGSVVLPKVSIGWPMVLSSLKSLLETGKALELEMPGGGCGEEK